MTDTQLSPDLTDLDGLVAVGAPADGSIRRFRAGSYDEALAMALDELGPEVEVVEANRIRRGGLGGFFATDLGIEITVTTATAAGGRSGGPGTDGPADRTGPAAAVRPYLPEDLGTADRGSLAGQSLGMTDARLQELLDRAEEAERRDLPQRRPGTSTPFADAYAEQVRAQLGDRPQAATAEIDRAAPERSAAVEGLPAVDDPAAAGAAASPGPIAPADTIADAIAVSTPGAPSLAVDGARAVHVPAPSAGGDATTAGSSGDAALSALGLDAASAGGALSALGLDAASAGGELSVVGLDAALAGGELSVVGLDAASTATTDRASVSGGTGAARPHIDAGPRLPAGCHRPIVRSAPSGFLDGTAVAERSEPSSEASADRNVPAEAQGDRSLPFDPSSGRERSAVSVEALEDRSLPFDASSGRERSAVSVEALEDRSFPFDASSGRERSVASVAPGDEPSEVDAPAQRSSRQLLTLLGTLGGPSVSPPPVDRSPAAGSDDLASPPRAVEAIAPPALPDVDDLPWAGTIRVAPPSAHTDDAVDDLSWAGAIRVVPPAGRPDDVVEDLSWAGAIRVVPPAAHADDAVDDLSWGGTIRVAPPAAHTDDAVDDLSWAGAIRVAPPAGRPDDVVENLSWAGAIRVVPPAAHTDDTADDPGAVALLPDPDPGTAPRVTPAGFGPTVPTAESVVADVSPATTSRPTTGTPTGSIAGPSVGARHRVSADADAVAVVMPMEGAIHGAPVDLPAAISSERAVGGEHV